MEINVKNKKYFYGVGIIAFLIIYYVFFTHGKVNLTFSARDLIVNTIENQEDFEDTIIKNVYEKIVDSCDLDNKYIKNNFISPFGFVDDEINVIRQNEELRRSGLSFGSSNISNNLKGSSTTADISTSISSKSIDFDGTPSIETVTQGVNFSQTNIQKQDVDEGDILKQTKDYVFYFSKSKSKIYIIKSPLAGEKLDIKLSEAIFTINIPSNLTLKPELFVNDSRLIYLASKKSYDNNNTIVGIYDISNLEKNDVKLYKIFETKGDYFKSRLINNNLYLISDYSMHSFKSKYCNILHNKSGSSFVDFISFFTGIKIKGFGLNKELYSELKEELESYSYKFDNNNLSGNGTSENLKNFKIYYTNKDLKESIENLNFNVVSVLDIEKTDTKASQILLFGNLKNGEIHMTLDNLYLVNSYYQKEQWKCDYIDICYKEFASNFFTSISKISYSGNELKYLSSKIIPGKPINQYSMDDDEGYFRIFTANGNSNTNASLYVFDKKLKLIGQLENIKPGEQFKSSRFIGDKAYLVTFRQTDPLFVIDLHIPSDPKIIGELHIPGYSSYLHPYGKIGNKEYLIGLGIENRKVKVDLYEIDYDKLGLGGNIDVRQKYSYIFSGNDSTSPALDNPRAFVWDNESKILYLPLQTNGNYIQTECNQEEISNGLCISTYDRFTGKYINKISKQVNGFTGLKALEIKVEENIKEIVSKEFNTNLNINNSRVGYYKNQSQNILFFVEDTFISFFTKLDEKTVKFD